MTGLKDKQLESSIGKGEGSAEAMEEEIKDEGVCCMCAMCGVKKCGVLRCVECEDVWGV